MLSRDLIRLLQEIDPSGDLQVSIGAHDIGVIEYASREDVGGQEVIMSSSALVPGILPDIAHVTVYHDGPMIRLLPYSASDISEHYDGRIPINHIFASQGVA